MRKVPEAEALVMRALLGYLQQMGRPVARVKP
jgi:hypothetical protein